MGYPQERASNVGSTLSREPETQDEPTGAHDRLRAAGLRSTPQRQAILAAFRGGVFEHLSADEVYARASVSLPGLSRGTVYATLAEFSEVGLLSAFGTPEPVRYETNIEQHGHFRCRLCLRIFDVDVPPLDPASFEAQRHQVEGLELRGEGICAECVDYGAGLSAGAHEIVAVGSALSILDRPIAAVEIESPLGPLLLAASANGLVRLAFAEQAQLAMLRERVGAEGTGEAHAHLAVARQQLEAYFSGEPRSPVSPIDWEALDASEALWAPIDVPYGTLRSYHLLAPQLSADILGWALGCNPVPIFIPCHRVLLGSTIPDSFVGGAERRQWLLARERSAAMA